jgi:hypothetical protein
VLPLRVGLDPEAPYLAAVFVGVAAGQDPQRRFVEFSDGEHKLGDLLWVAIGDVLESVHGAGGRAPRWAHDALHFREQLTTLLTAVADGARQRDSLASAS